jgi:serine protease Do
MTQRRLRAYPRKFLWRDFLWREFLWAAAVMVVMAWATGQPAVADELGPNRAELIHNLLPTVVNISVRREEVAAPAASPAMVGSTMPTLDASPVIKGYVGSGFIIDPSGLIVTNYHVVENAFEITVTLFDGTRLAGKTLSASRSADLALVQVEAGRPLAAARWGDSDRLQVGDQVFAAGNPFGIGLSVSAGIVSGLNRDIQNSAYDDLIQTDATINHGNSGGPLFDMQGNVVGVDSAIISPTAGSVGIGFALPSNTASFVIGRLRTYGWVRPGWVGVKVQQVTPEIAEAEGAIVAWVLPDGPAMKAGLAIGDLILTFDGRTPTDERALLRDIAQTPVGETVNLLVQHEGTERSVPITIQEWPRNQWEARDGLTPALQPKIVIPPDLGLALSVPTEAEKVQFGAANSQNGVLVAAVAPNSDPAHRGMASGDLILRVQDNPVGTPAEVQSGIDAARATKRDYVLMLVLPKKQDIPGPKWMALRLATSGG